MSTHDARALRFGLAAAVSVVAGVLIEAIALHGRGYGLFALAGLSGYGYFAARGLRIWHNGDISCLHGPGCWCQAGFDEADQPRPHGSIGTPPEVSFP
ncbi:MAG TPA: hypothetical protein VGK70_05460 [Thermoanaerobaculia bacterium]